MKRPKGQRSSLPAAEALRLWVILNRSLRAVLQAIQKNEQREIPLRELAVLEILQHKGPLPIQEIASRILVTSGSTTYVVDKLEKRGLVTRRPSTEDRRVTFAELTPAGRALIERVFPLHAEAIRVALDGLTDDEKRQAVALLKKLGFHAAAVGDS